MADESFKPTESELEFLKAKRVADQANAIDLAIIKPGMSREDTERVKKRIAELWK